MGRVSFLPGLLIVSLLGVTLLSTGGCGGDGSSAANATPERGAQQKQARIKEYGQSGMPSTTKGSTPDPNGRAAARR